MKKLKIFGYYKAQAERMLNRTSVTYTELQFFSWRESPQGYNYWLKKYNIAARKPYGDPTTWDDILTEEDYSYFKVLLRKGFRKDTFLSSPAQKEYVKFAEELPFE